MALTKQKFTSYLKAADFRTLFIEEMGWNKVNASFSSMPTFYAGETSFEIKAIAHRNGFQVLQCSVEELPSNATCKKLDIKLRKAANDYICIFIIPGTEHHQWVAPIKTNEKRDIVIIEYADADESSSGGNSCTGWDGRSVVRVYDCLCTEYPPESYRGTYVEADCYPLFSCNYDLPM